MSSGFAWALGLRLRGLIDAEDIDAIDIESAVQTALQLRESQLVAAVTGAAARTLFEHGEIERARAIVEKALEVVAVPDQAYWLCSAAAELLDDDGCRDSPRACSRRSRKIQAIRSPRHFFGSSTRAAPAMRRARARRGRRISRARLARRRSDRGGGRRRTRTRGGDLRTHRRDARAAPPAHRQHSAIRARTRYALTRREREIVELAARGYSNKLIASETAIGERTVETHLAAAYRKLGVRSRAELAALFSGGSTAVS